MTVYDRATLKIPQPKYCSILQAVHCLATGAEIVDDALFEKLQVTLTPRNLGAEYQNIIDDIFKAGYSGILKAKGCKTQPFYANDATIGAKYTQRISQPSKSYNIEPISKSAWQTANSDAIFWHQNALVLENNEGKIVIWIDVTINVDDLNAIFAPADNISSKSKPGKKYDRGLQNFINQLKEKFLIDDIDLTLTSLCRFFDNFDSYNSCDGTPDCGDIYIDGDFLYFTDADARHKKRALRTLERYISRAYSG